MQDIWRILDENGVDVVVNGHDERFNPQDSAGNPDPNGTVEFVVGTEGCADGDQSYRSSLGVK